MQFFFILNKPLKKIKKQQINTTRRDMLAGVGDHGNGTYDFNRFVTVIGSKNVYCHCLSLLLRAFASWE